MMKKVFPEKESAGVKQAFYPICIFFGFLWVSIGFGMFCEMG